MTTKTKIIYVERVPTKVQTKEKEDNPIFEVMSFLGSTTRAGFKKLNDADRK